MCEQFAIVYHGRCLDGFASAFVFWTVYGENAIYLTYNNDVNDIDGIIQQIQGKHTFILDTAFPLEYHIKAKSVTKSIKVLDHHISNNEHMKELPEYIFDVNKSGVGIAWDYLYKNKAMPYFLQLIQDRDLWLFKYNDTKPFYESISLMGQNFMVWRIILENESMTYDMIKEGRRLLEKTESQVKNHTTGSTEITWLGYKIRIVNASVVISEIGNKFMKIYPEIDFAMIVVYDFAKKFWCVSLRGKDKVDLSQIAKKFGGGGHFNASGFKWRKTLEELVNQ